MVVDRFLPRDYSGGVVDVRATPFVSSYKTLFSNYFIVVFSLLFGE